MSELPEGWTAASLDDLGSWGSGGTPRAGHPDYYGGSIPFTKIGDLKDSCFGCTEDTLTEAGLAASAAKWVPADSLLIAMYGSIGKLGINTVPVTTNQAIAFIEPDPALTSTPFLFWLLKASRPQLVAMGQGGTQQNISQKLLRAHKVALPPLAEQRRIVAKLDALTARTARARADLDRIPALAARYKQAVLDAAYGGHLSDQPLGQLAVADVISRLDQGWSPKCESEAAGEGEWGVIKTTAIQGIWFDELANKRLPSHLEARPAIEIVAGDVLITRAGPRSRVGVTCVVRQTRDRLMLCDKAYRLRVKPGVMNAEFLALMLNSPQALRAIEEMKTGISDSGLNLTQGKLLALSLPVPPVDEQKRLVAKIDRAFTEIDRLTAEAAAARRLLDRLDQAILAKAFRGELVPQDPADEPADVLLERIRAERAAAPKPKRGRRKAAA